MIFFLGLLEAFILGSLTALVLDLLAGLRSLLAALVLRSLIRGFCFSQPTAFGLLSLGWLFWFAFLLVWCLVFLWLSFLASIRTSASGICIPLLRMLVTLFTGGGDCNFPSYRRRLLEEVKLESEKLSA